MAHKSYAVPITVQSEIQDIVSKFNKEHLAKQGIMYWVDVRGKFIYLFHGDSVRPISPVCRLTYDGDLENMTFAIFKWSTEKYDANEFFFPGYEFVNGTLIGAMKAGIKAYG